MNHDENMFSSANRDGRGLLHELEELALRGAGVAEQQHVDIPPQPGVVGQDLPCAAEQQASHRLLNPIHVVLARGAYGRSDGLENLILTRILTLGEFSSSGSAF